MPKPRIPCHFPWTNMYVSPNGDVRHCCSTDHKAIGNLGTQTVTEIWNSPKFREVRRHVAAGDFDKARCNPNCEGLRNGKGFPWPADTVGSGELEANQRRAAENFAGGAQIVDHLPTQLKIEFTDNCNFRCVMCFYDFIPPYNMVPERAVEQLRSAARVATHVVLMGGEVFMNRFDLDFIKRFSPAEGGSMGFVTNASMLDDEKIALLRKFRRMGMQISIDGTTKDVFERIRVRGRWETVDANIRRVVQAARELSAEGYEWNIHLAYVVMRSNLHDLAHAVSYAADLDVPIFFNPVKGFHLFDENIFVYVRPLRSSGNWQRLLDAAFSTLEQRRTSYSHYETVRAHLEEIRRYLSAGKIDVPRGVLRLLRLVVKNDKDIGHLLGAFFGWRVEGVSLFETLSYVGDKTWRRLRARVSKSSSPSRAARGATGIHPGERPVVP
ncbi:MAG: radical SAM protein [Vicinamibacteria bacterium]